MSSRQPRSADQDGPAEQVGTVEHDAPIKQAASEFLDQRRIAVTGVSRSPKNHGANVVYVRLRDRGYDVVAVNPNADTVEGDRCFSDLASIPGGVDGVVIGTAPSRALATVEECIRLGIPRVWFHRGPGGGSVDPEAAEVARRAGLTVIDGGCPCMFGPTADLAHRCMRPVLTLTGNVPRRV
jgi:predicted CoA-binding protein